MTERCPWCGTDPEYVRYHDEEWGVPEHDDRRLFEKLSLEGAQAGLSWISILRRRDNYRAAFLNFDVMQLAEWGPADVERLLGDAGIIRNRAKIESVITNARAFIAMQVEFGSFDAYIWGYVDGVPVQNRFQSMADMPAHTPVSTALSKDLKRRGFKFVGPTIAYSLMQAMGLVNDHLVTCFRRDEIARMR